jgi:glycosyltransferase involved in cell wall biosynthesis
MKACDIYIQPSRYEGKAVTVREAQILAKPVVITDFPTSQSQLTHDFDGYIIPLENQVCAEALNQFISNKILQQKLIENCKQSDFSNRSEIGKIVESTQPYFENKLLTLKKKTVNLNQ